jgi:hypothetical protein
MRNLITNGACGGIIIIPLNFWSSIRKHDIILRRDFLKKYTINHLNIFEEPVFQDTTTTVCSFSFSTKENISNDINVFNVVVFPLKTTLVATLNAKNGYMIDGGYI